MATVAEKSTGIITDDSESKDQPKTVAVDASSSSSKLNSYQSVSSTLPRPLQLQRSSTTPLFSCSSSTTSSPKPSREPSPIRPSLRSSTFAVPRGPRSRKNSQELSPNRPQTSSIIPAVPSAAAIQRALSAAGTPQLQPSSNSDPSFDVTRSQKPAKGLGGGTNHLGLNLPRVKSPPLSTSSSKSSIYSPRNKYDQSSLTPSIILEHPTPVTESKAGIDEAEEGTFLASGMRTPVRGPSVSAPTLETVQESIVPNTLSPGATKPHHGGKGGSDDRPESIVEDSMEEHLAKGTKTRPESGSESGGNKSTATSKESREVRRPGNSAKPHIMHPKKSITQLHPVKTKSVSEGTAKNMTVETETVSTIPQVALGGGAVERTASGRVETGGSLRLKPSNETIRPRKDKKKVMRKAPSISAGTASSKADIFEAKVASAVDEVNSSDSDETFVYESNPPEPLSARPHRFHSRTPSATSMASQLDQYGVKGRQDGHHSIAGKKSMKFSNNSYHTAGYPSESNGGTVRGPSQGARPAGHHIGRYGRGGHTSIFDTESPFTNTTRPLRTTANNIGRLSSRPSSPRSPNFVRVSTNPMKLSEPCQSYDLEGEEADNERTPLVGSIRSSRHRYARRPVSGTSRNGYSAEGRGHPLCRRITAFFSLGALLAVLIAAIVIILVLCSQPLYDVHVKDIRNVLASEQEIMLDINVHAVNPNLIALQVSDLDVNIFAKSKHVRTNALWRSQHRKLELGWEDLRMESEPFLHEEHQAQQGPSNHYHSQETVDEGNDPIEDPETDSQTMLLGRIFEFDSPLIFDPSPIRHRSLSSIGEVRLAKPGNQTEEDGTERWERVMQHEFELIVRGVLRYSLPISSKVQSASIAGRVLVHPGGGEERMDSIVATVSPFSHTLKRGLLRIPGKFRVNTFFETRKHTFPFSATSP